MILDFRLYYKATVIKNNTILTLVLTHRLMEQNREPRNKLTQVWLINLQWGDNNIQWWKDILFNSDAGKAGQLHVKNKLEYFLTPYTKISSKCIRDLNIRLETITFLK